MMSHLVLDRYGYFYLVYSILLMFDSNVYHHNAPPPLFFLFFFSYIQVNNEIYEDK